MATERPGDAMVFHANTMPRPTNMHSDSEDDYAARDSSASSASHGQFDSGRLSGEGSPMMMSPWNHTTMPPFASSSWSTDFENAPQNTLIGSLVREEGHIYSLAASGDLLYTGSDSKNIRVWKNLQEFSGFKSNSGLVKAIIISDRKIFTGHQDGKIRVWKVSPKNLSAYKRAGTLPSLKDIFKSSIRPRNYVEVKKNRTTLWIKHCDAVSCLCLSMDKTILYSASWDRTIKVWRLSDSKCLESISAHDDAVNSVVCGAEGMMFSGSADGTVKAWRREQQGKGTKHVAANTLLKQEFAVTSLAVDPTGSIVYGGSSDGIVNFWKREKQYAHGGVMKGHKLGVLCMVSAGNLLFSGSADKTICLWRREGDIHTSLSVLKGHDGPVKCLAVMQDKETSAKGDERWVVYSGSLDKSVKVWSVSGQSVATGQQMLDFDSIPSDGSFSSSTRPSNKRKDVYITLS